MRFFAIFISGWGWTGELWSILVVLILINKGSIFFIYFLQKKIFCKNVCIYNLFLNLPLDKGFLWGSLKI